MNSDTPYARRPIDPMAFACRFFEARGGILESGGEHKIVLLPKEAARSLEIEELFKIGPETVPHQGGDPSKMYTVQFHTPLLDRMVSLAGSARPFAGAQLKFDYIKTEGFDRLIFERFTLHKSKIKVVETDEAETRYLVLTCRFTVQSDELKQGLLDICFNLDTGAVIPHMATGLDLVQKEFTTSRIRGCSKQEIENIHGVVRRYGLRMIEERLSSFVDSMNRRFRRDASSLEEYYNALEREMKESLGRSGLSDRLTQERREKIAMIPKELAAKKKDLLNKYSINIDFKPVAAMALSTPCVKVSTRLLSGRKQKNLPLTYNPVTKNMDPVVCRSCGISTYHFGCSSHMHINCPACMG